MQCGQIAWRDEVPIGKYLPKFFDFVNVHMGFSPSLYRPCSLCTTVVLFTTPYHSCILSRQALLLCLYYTDVKCQYPTCVGKAGSRLNSPGALHLPRQSGMGSHLLLHIWDSAWPLVGVAACGRGHSPARLHSPVTIGHS